MENSLFFEYGPSWKKRRNVETHHYTCSDPQIYAIPDGINCGPVINNMASTSLSKDTTPAGREKIPEVKIRQKPSAKFPYHCVTPSLQPLQPKVPANSHSVFMSSEAGTYYYSNALSSFTLNDSDHLIFGEHSGISHIVKLAMIKKRNSSEQTFLKLKRKRNLSKYNFLHQADSAVVDGTPYALLRIDDTINFVRIGEESFALHSIPENRTTDCRLNRTLDNNFAFANEDGNLFVYDIVKNKSTWGGHFLDSINKNKWLGCEFGCHPLQMNVACESRVWLIDSRSAPFVGNSRQVFNLKEMGGYIDEYEVVCNFKSVSERPFVYVICSETVFLMDTRHYRHPVLTWQHMMTRQPSYPHILKENELHTLLLAEPLSFKICVMASSWDQADFPHIQAISIPKHINVAKETLAFARQNDLLFSDNIERNFKSPLVGLTVLPSEKKKKTIYLQNKFGNLFYSKIMKQDEEEILDTESGKLEYWEQFEKMLYVQTKPNSKYKLESVPYLENIKTRVRARTNRIVETPTCKGSVWNLSDVYKNKNNQCFESRVDENIIERITEDPSPINFFSEKNYDNLSHSFLTNCSDSLSKSLLSIWHDHENKTSEKLISSMGKVENPPFLYQKFPIDVDNGIVELPNFQPYRSFVENSQIKPIEVDLDDDDDVQILNEQLFRHDSPQFGKSASASSVVKKGFKRRKSHVSGF